MNIELIKELIDLKSKNLSYTEIAEITGLARTSIVLSLRLNTIFENSYSSKITSLNNEIDLLNSNLISLRKKAINKDLEIKNLTSLINVDHKINMIISKDKYHNLHNELTNFENEVDMLNTKLANLNNLSFSKKLEWLFIPKEIK